jgi:hypothetical protein
MGDSGMERYTIPEYRLELFAQDAEHNQMLKNIFRRMFRLPIKITGKEAGDAFRRQYLNPDFQAQVG